MVQNEGKMESTIKSYIKIIERFKNGIWKVMSRSLFSLPINSKKNLKKLDQFSSLIHYCIE